MKKKNPDNSRLLDLVNKIANYLPGSVIQFPGLLDGAFLELGSLPGRIRRKPQKSR